MNNKEYIQDIKQQTSIKKFCEEHLEAKGKTYICPFCNSGKKKNGTPAFTLYEDTQTFYCFGADCNKTGDIFNLCGAIIKSDSLKDQIEYVRRWANIPDINSISFARSQPANIKKQEQNYTNFYKQCRKDIKTYDKYSYLEKRGIRKETQDLFNIGYCPNWKPPTNSKAPATERIIIPRTKNSYLARAINDKIEKQYQKQVTGKQELFGIDKVAQNEVFIVEGEIDLMSIWETSHTGTALGSTSNKDKLIEYAKIHREKKYILMLDNDDAGKKATEYIKEKFEENKIIYIQSKYTGKDPNDALITNEEEFKKLTDKLAEEVNKVEKPINKYSALEVINKLKDSHDKPNIFEAPTGFRELDNKLSGGLHEGLYILGANSSLGKTTFCLQLANQISKNGNDVIFFSLEMSAEELIAKGISKTTYLNCKDIYKAKDTQHILNNKYYKNGSEEDKNIIDEATEDYMKECENLYIYEGKYKDRRIQVKDIESIVKDHITDNEQRKPVIFIDYLQIIKTDDKYMTDKQAIDSIVEKLKDISRELKIPVIAVSSFNRDNYKNSVNMSAFKESGAIEYSSDILFGLQLKGITDDKNNNKKIYEDSTEHKKRKESNDIELVCLKYRNGYPFTINFNYLNAFNYYKEDKQEYLAI